MRENRPTVHKERKAESKDKKRPFRKQKSAAETPKKPSRLSGLIRKHKIISSIVAVAAIVSVAGGTWWYFDTQQQPDSSSSKVRKVYQSKLPNLKQAIDDNPNDSNAHKNYAIALYATGDLEGARKQYEETVRLNDKDAIAYNYLGNVYRDLGRYNDAIKSYETSISLNNP